MYRDKEEYSSVEIRREEFDDDEDVFREGPLLPFWEEMKRFEWDKLKNARKEYQAEKAGKYLNKFQRILDEYNLMEPKIPVNRSCQKPPPIPPGSIDCSRYPRAFQRKRKRAAKIAIAVQLGYDADTLEIYLNEVFDVVDKFFIVEWTKSHNRQIPFKRLIWDSIKMQDRFFKFRSKIIHIILDDVDTSEVFKNAFPTSVMRKMAGVWKVEGAQEKKRWEAIKKWNSKAKFFGLDDMIAFGDADEVPSRENVQLIKYCYPSRGRSIDIGIWFPHGLDKAFRSDFPVQGHPFTLGDPTFFSFRDASSQDPYPSRRRGKSKNYLLGGMHMTDYPYLPFYLSKKFSCTECRKNIDFITRVFPRLIDRKEWDALEHQRDSEWKRIGRRRSRYISDLREELEPIVYIPWFLACNRERYPSWYGNHDPRLDFVAGISSTKSIHDKEERTSEEEVAGVQSNIESNRSSPIDLEG